MRIPSTLKKLRHARGIKQREMATLLGISIRQYSKLETGDCMPSVKQEIIIARRLGVENPFDLWKGMYI